MRSVEMVRVRKLIDEMVDDGRSVRWMFSSCAAGSGWRTDATSRLSTPVSRLHWQAALDYSEPTQNAKDVHRCCDQDDLVLVR